MVTKKISNKIKGKVLKFLNLIETEGIVIERAYIFGSRARGDTHKGSDIDVCVISIQFIDAYEAFMKMQDISSSRNELLDIEGHGYTPEYFDNAFAEIPYEVRRYGIRVK